MQQVGPVFPGTVVNPGDQLVLHLDESVCRFRERRFHRAEQDGTALCRLEAPQAPGIVGIAPAGEQPPRRGMGRKARPCNLHGKKREHGWDFAIFGRKEPIPFR